MTNPSNFEMRLDIFPETYNAGTTVAQVKEMIGEISALNENDSLLLIHDGKLTTVTVGALKNAIGGSGDGPSVVDSATYLTIKDE